MHTGKLYLIPSLLGEQLPEVVLPATIKDIIQRIDHFIVENEKSARHFIKKIDGEKIQSAIHFYLIDKHTSQNDSIEYLEICKNGTDMGVISEAGMPAIADPGAHIVQKAHQAGIQVVPLVGPSAILLAMMSSGLNGQNFAFIGYLPIDEAERKKKLKQIESWSATYNQAQIFIETPFRNQKLFNSLINFLHPKTLLCIATDITLSTEFIKTKTVSDWKKQVPDLHKRPTIFIIQSF